MALHTRTADPGIDFFTAAGIMNTTTRSKMRGTPLAAWFLLISAIATLFAGLQPLFGRGGRDPNWMNVYQSQFAQQNYGNSYSPPQSSNVSAAMLVVGVILGSVVGCFMGIFSLRPVRSAIAGTLAGAFLGGLTGAQLGVDVNVLVTLLGAAIMIVFSLVTRYYSRKAATAALLAPLVVMGLLVPSVVAADPAQAAKPKVLILGDSISLGYTPLVKTNLADVAEVSRPRENCQHSAYGLQMIDKWLGKEKWDVIHFNWGIWDTHMLDASGALVRDEATAKGPLHLRHTPEQYRENLTSLVKTLKATGAKLIWASTTPIMRYKGKRYEDLTTLNKIAAEIMKENDVAIDDLYEYTMPNVAKWQSGDKVHFTAPGNEELAKKVSKEIRKALPVKK
jgi:hypothetical protein